MFVLIYSMEIPGGMTERHYRCCFGSSDDARESALKEHGGTLFWVDVPRGSALFGSYGLYGKKPRSMLHAQAGDTDLGLPQTYSILEFS